MIAAIENKILEALKEAEPALGYEFSTLESYPENWEDYFSKSTNVWGDTAAWVTFAGLTTISQDSGGVLCEGRLGLIVAARNYRNQRIARHGEDGLVGTYQIAEDCVKIFHGNNLNLEIGELNFNGLSFVSLKSVIEKTGLVPMALDFKFEFYFEKQDANAALGDFNTLLSNWDVPPFLNNDQQSILKLEQTGG